jgi:hypothetical protein
MRCSNGQAQARMEIERKEESKLFVFRSVGRRKSVENTNQSSAARSRGKDEVVKK